MGRRKAGQTLAATRQMDNVTDAEDGARGQSVHVPWREYRKWSSSRLDGSNIGDVPLNRELKLEVWDSANSAGVMIDAPHTGAFVELVSYFRSDLVPMVARP